MPRPGPSVTSGADLQPGSDSLFPSGFTGGGARPSAGSVGTGEIADGSVSGADLNLASVTAALNGTYAQRRQGAGRFVALGDSITIRNSGTTTYGLTSGDSWATFTALASGGSMLLQKNAGHGGFTSTQILAAMPADLAGLTPETIGICAGLNDNLDGSNLPTTTAANIKSLVAASRALGASVFLCTLPPQGSAALATPAAATVTTATTGGTLGAATYSYRVAALNAVGTTLASTAATVVTSGSTSANTIAAPHVEGATSYKLYGRTGGSELLIATNGISGNQDIPQRWFVDTGSVTPSGALPGSNTTAITVDSTATLKIATINNWLRRYAALNGIPLVDFFAVLADPTTGMYRTGYTYDGTHPTPTSARRMGSAAWATLQNWVVPAPAPTVRTNVDPTNLWANGCLVNGTANLPTGWSSNSGTGANFTDTLGAVTGFAGNGFTCALTAPDTRFHSSTAIGGTPWTTGDQLLVSARIATTGCEAGGMNANFRLREFAGNSSLCELNLSASDIAGVWTTQVTAPPTNNVAWQLNLAYGAGSITVGELSIFNLTTGQLLTP